MRNIKIIITVVLFCVGFNVVAQPEISPERKQAIDSLALEKVKDLGKYISIILCKLKIYIFLCRFVALSLCS